MTFSLPQIYDSWRRIKKDFLHHFHLPRIDLLVWIIITKLAPTYYRKLDVRLTNIGRYRELPDWRKAFKRQWNRSLHAKMSWPINPKYKPDTHRWVCTCPYFVTSRFLLCKHLVQSVKPVDPIFFLEVQRNRTTPFWSHPRLRSLESAPSAAATVPNLEAEDPREDEDLIEPSVEDEVLDAVEEFVDTEAAFCANRTTFKERLSENIRIIEEFTRGLKHQIQFSDPRFLQTLERDGAGFFRLASNCLDLERRFHSTRVRAPNTWDSGATNTMFYRARPPPAERDS